MAGHISTIVRRTILATIAALCFLAPVAAAQSVSQAYDAPDGVQKGMIVMVDKTDSKRIMPLKDKNDADMLGVIVAANDTILSFGNDSKSSQVYVANNGKYEVLVSTQNGPIAVGDIITVSSVDGIGMKADTSQSVVLGKALTSFDGKTNVSSTMTLKTTTGSRKVSFGKVTVDISIAHNPIQVSVTGPPVPAFFKKAGEVITGKAVSTVRIYIALIVLLLTVFMSGNLMYGGVKSSLTAIGRNPLAKGAVSKGLLQVIILGVIVLVLGLFSVYLVLKM